VAAAATAARRLGVGRTWRRSICQLAVIATALYWTKVAIATLDLAMAANHVYWAPAMPTTDTAISSLLCPRGHAGRKATSRSSPPHAMRTPTSQPGST
jgi:hypothetical protein